MKFLSTIQEEIYINPKTMNHKEIDDALLILEAGIIKQILKNCDSRPTHINFSMHRRLFDENPKVPALKGLVGYEVSCHYNIV